jgi:hypothetical protein
MPQVWARTTAATRRIDDELLASNIDSQIATIIANHSATPFKADSPKSRQGAAHDPFIAAAYIVNTDQSG